jgi:hypothetical protein
LAWPLAWLHAATQLPLWDMVIIGTLVSGMATLLALCWNASGGGWLFGGMEPGERPCQRSIREQHEARRRLAGHQAAFYPEPDQNVVVREVHRGTANPDGPNE